MDHLLHVLVITAILQLQWIAGYQTTPDTNLYFDTTFSNTASSASLHIIPRSVNLHQDLVENASESSVSSSISVTEPNQENRNTISDELIKKPGASIITENGTTSEEEIAQETTELAISTEIAMTQPEFKEAIEIQSFLPEDAKSGAPDVSGTVESGQTQKAEFIPPEAISASTESSQSPTKAAEITSKLLHVLDVFTPKYPEFKMSNSTASAGQHFHAYPWSETMITRQPRVYHTLIPTKTTQSSKKKMLQKLKDATLDKAYMAENELEKQSEVTKKWNIPKMVDTVRSTSGDVENVSNDVVELDDAVYWNRSMHALNETVKCHLTGHRHPHNLCVARVSAGINNGLWTSQDREDFLHIHASSPGEPLLYLRWGKGQADEPITSSQIEFLNPPLFPGMTIHFHVYFKTLRLSTPHVEPSSLLVYSEAIDDCVKQGAVHQQVPMNHKDTWSRVTIPVPDDVCESNCSCRSRLLIIGRLLDADDVIAISELEFHHDAAETDEDNFHPVRKYIALVVAAAIMAGGLASAGLIVGCRRWLSNRKITYKIENNGENTKEESVEAHSRAVQQALNCSHGSCETKV